MARLITLDLPTESVTFNREDVIVREHDSGISIQAKPERPGIGFLRQFFPWNEIRRVTETDDNA